MDFRTLTLLSAWVLGLGFTGCGGMNLFDADNLTTLRVDLDIHGTPAVAGSGPNADIPKFQVELHHRETGWQSGAPINPRLLPKEFEQVPIGLVRVFLTDNPPNCIVESEPSKDVRLLRGEERTVAFVITCR